MEAASFGATCGWDAEAGEEVAGGGGGKGAEAAKQAEGTLSDAIGGAKLRAAGGHHRDGTTGTGGGERLAAAKRAGRS